MTDARPIIRLERYQGEDIKPLRIHPFAKGVFLRKAEKDTIDMVGPFSFPYNGKLWINRRMPNRSKLKIGDVLLMKRNHRDYLREGHFAIIDHMYDGLDGFTVSVPSTNREKVGFTGIKGQVGFDAWRGAAYDSFLFVGRPGKKKKLISSKEFQDIFV